MFISCDKMGSTFGSMGSSQGGMKMRDAALALLVNVVNNLRVPDVLYSGDRIASLGLGEDIPIAIVIVAYIVLPQLGRLAAFIRCVQGFAIPASDDVHAVRIQRRDKDQDGVLADGLKSRRLIRQHFVRKLDGAVGGCDFGGVNGARHQNDILALRKQRFRFRGRGDARVGQTALNIAILVQLPQSFRRTDDGFDEWAAFDALAEFLYLNASRRGFLQFVEIGDDLVPIEKNAIYTDLVTEMAFGSRDGSGAKGVQIRQAE